MALSLARATCQRAASTKASDDAEYDGDCCCRPVCGAACPCRRSAGSAVADATWDSVRCPASRDEPEAAAVSWALEVERFAVVRAALC